MALCKLTSPFHKQYSAPLFRHSILQRSESISKFLSISSIQIYIIVSALLIFKTSDSYSTKWKFPCLLIIFHVNMSQGSVPDLVREIVSDWTHDIQMLTSKINQNLLLEIHKPPWNGVTYHFSTILSNKDGTTWMPNSPQKNKWSEGHNWSQGLEAIPIPRIWHAIQLGNQMLQATMLTIIPHWYLI